VKFTLQSLVLRVSQQCHARNLDCLDTSYMYFCKHARNSPGTIRKKVLLQLIGG